MTTQKQGSEFEDEAPLAGAHSTSDGQNALRVKVGKYANWLVIDAGGIKLCIIRHSDGPVDPLSDLNACAEFEKGLTADQHYTYRCKLWELTDQSQDRSWKGVNGEEHNRRYISATAEQRCRAFVAVMESK